MEPLVWNIRTGHLVGGHQRIRALDDAVGGKPYLLRVAQIDVDENEERNINLSLNNGELAGVWDMDKLAEELRRPGLDQRATGFGSADLYKILGDAASADAVAECAKRVAEIADVRPPVDEARKSREDFYLVVVFPDHDARQVWCNRLGLDDTRYQSSEDLQGLARTHEGPTGEPAGPSIPNR